MNTVYFFKVQRKKDSIIHDSKCMNVFPNQLTSLFFFGVDNDRMMLVLHRLSYSYLYTNFSLLTNINLQIRKKSSQQKIIINIV